MGTITCPKCSSINATPFACEACGATFAKPLAFDDPRTAAPSAALLKELQIDRRKTPRTATPPPPPAQATGTPAWLEEPAAPKAPTSVRPSTLPSMARAAQAPAQPQTQLQPPPLPAPVAVKPVLPIAAAPVAPMAPATPAAVAPKLELPMPESPPVARSTAVRSAEIRVEEIHATPASAVAQIGAFLVDAAVLCTALGIYLFVAQTIAGRVAPTQLTGLDYLIDRAVAWKRVLVPGIAFGAALTFVYSSLFHALGGRTLGKRLFGLTLVDSSGLPPRLARSAVRAGLSFLSFGALLMGLVLMLFDRKKQALHDKLTSTFVVRLAE